MESRSRGLYIVAAAIVLVGVMLAIAGVRKRSETASQSGEHFTGEGSVPAGGKAADFSLQTLDGGNISMAGLRGKVVFLNVWATWCGPCREEMPSMETLYGQLKDKKDFVMLAVSEDELGRQVVKPYVEKHGYHFTIVLDPENKVGSAYGLSGVPETFIISRDGRIVAHHMGAFDWSRPDVREALQEMLDAKNG